VKEVTATGVVTPDGRHVECDVIAWCTGFDVAAPLKSLRVVGRGGRDLGATWKDGLHAYRGTTVPGFPNMYVLMGPNTGLGHNSMVYMIESQIQFALAHLHALDASGGKTVEVTEAAERAFNEALQAKVAGTVWASGCSSWYLDANGRNVMLWPGTTFSFRKLTRAVELSDVQISDELSPSPRGGEGRGEG
jgi:cation diffusion facilitator CzcD-associated flavoprotein CzcO